MAVSKRKAVAQTGFPKQNKMADLQSGTVEKL